MATENNVFATLACCLVAVSFAMAQSNMTNWTVLASTTPGSNTTAFVTSPNTTENGANASKATENTTPFTSTSNNNTTFTETTSHTQTTGSTTDSTPLINTTSLTTAPGNNTTAFTAPTNQTTTGDTSTPATTVLTTVYSSNTANTTSESEAETTQAVGLNESEKSMTIVFSVFLGLFGFGLVVLMFTRCRHKFQYMHQPLNNTSDADAFVVDDDTLVISGGLYDGHANYDNAPTAPTDESQFRLEFLH